MATTDATDGRTGSREARTRALQALARDVFGRNLDAESAWRLRERLPTLAEAVRLIQAPDAMDPGAPDVTTAATVFRPVACHRRDR